MTETRSKKVSIRTTGCRLNQYESERMLAELYQHGFVPTQPGEQADLYIINTCTVTHRADQTSRNLIRRAIRENPDAKVVVAGCYVESDPALLAGIEGVDLLVKNEEKDLITKILPRSMPELFTLDPGNGCKAPVARFENHNRAWIKVSDGCNQNCSYCILPSVRGRLRHRPVEDILTEVSGLVELGFKEVVITGLNMGYYRQKTEPKADNLADLCRIVLDRTDLYRIRLSSLEPQTLTDELVSACRESERRICPHFHVSLQSGSDRILKIMRRPYTRETYIEKVSAIKDAQPNTIIGADIIVGFPGETDADFNESQSLAESGLIDYLHVFSYSDRPGTTAAELPDKVNPQVIKDRNAILGNISKQLLLKANLNQIGHTLEPIAQFKKTDNRFHVGIAENYMRVRLPDTYPGGKDVVKVRITESLGDHVSGDII